VIETECSSLRSLIGSCCYVGKHPPPSSMRGDGVDAFDHFRLRVLEFLNRHFSPQHFIFHIDYHSHYQHCHISLSNPSLGLDSFPRSFMSPTDDTITLEGRRKNRDTFNQGEGEHKKYINIIIKRLC
jgi:hypothetical protein